MTALWASCPGCAILAAGSDAGALGLGVSQLAITTARQAAIPVMPCRLTILAPLLEKSKVDTRPKLVKPAGACYRIEPPLTEGLTYALDCAVGAGLAAGRVR